MRNRVSEHNLRFYVNIMLKLNNTLGDCCFIFIFISHLSLQYSVLLYSTVQTHIHICMPSQNYVIFIYQGVEKLTSFITHLPQKIKCFFWDRAVFFVYCFPKKCDIVLFAKHFKSDHVSDFYLNSRDNLQFTKRS